MGDSQPSSKVFSVRLVSIDYYMAPPILGLDISYSTVQGGKVNEVPVIRIYGSTPAGQKTCLHVHRALPYLYIACSDLGLTPDNEVDSSRHGIALSLEKALKLKGHAGSKRQHVHGCSLVRAKKFYGYHSSEELFVKIYLYYPQDVSRAANLLLGGAVVDKILQPYESHIPFLLQFLIDYNLYGMGQLHVSKIKFRYPVPDVFSPRKAEYNSQQKKYTDDSTCVTADFQADVDSDVCLGSQVWISSTIPDGWIWQYSNQLDPSIDVEVPLIKRQSNSELEGDAVVEEILNQQFIPYTSLSQSCSEVKMVQSLIPIWEEFERTGMHEAVIPPDPGKPLPQDVLRTLSDGVELGDLLRKVSNDAANSSSLTPEPIQYSTDCQNLVGLGHVNFEDSSNEYSKYLKASDNIGTLLLLNSSSPNFDGATPGENRDAGTKQLPADRMQISDVEGPSDMKASDEDALGLLKWLASSQAAEDINSDDELARDTILSPLLPSTTIGKVLEKASADYENNSQQECQDILDSVEDMAYFEGLNGRASNATEYNHSTNTSSNLVIPQVDGSSDDPHLSPCSGKSTKMETDSEFKSSMKACSWPEFDSSVTSHNKRKRPRWGSLPLSCEKVNDFSYAKNFNMTDGCNNEKRHWVGTSCLGNEAESCSNVVKVDANEDASYGEQASVIAECSARDLMRRKRCHRIDPSDRTPEVKDWQGDSSLDTKLRKGDSSLDQEWRNHMHGRESLIFPIHGPPVTNEETKCHERNTCTVDMFDEACHAKPINSYFSTMGELSLSSSSGNRAEIDTPNVGPSHSYQGLHDAVDTKIASTSENLGNKESTDIMGQGESPSCESLDSCVKEVKSGNSTSILVNMVAEGMTLFKKPPMMEWSEEPGIEARSLPGYENTNEGTFQGRVTEECLPFFMGNGIDEKELDVSSRKNDHVNCPESIMGVPIHYQNDGSYLYILTPALSPPLAECIHGWMSLDGSDIPRQKVAALSPLPPCSKSSLVDLVDSQSSQADACNGPFLESASLSNAMHSLDQLRQHNQESSNMEMKSLNGTGDIKQNEGNVLKSKPSVDCSQYTSQISGPDRNSKPTPLSQIGFRDPASVGGGQQLTLLSIEVQAESRGDLRPDPRFDPISFIVLVFQEDDRSTLNTHVLLHCKCDGSQRNLDAVLDCKVLVFSEELHLFNHFMKIIIFSDPDILMGWDVQSGSLGFLAERAAHLGIGLLNTISRSPSKINIGSGNLNASGKETVNGMFSESVAAEAVNLENAIVEDEWGRTHASGVHVGGRIVLNIWRLMRSEVKLNMYTFEAVAEAVLRRKVPSIHFNVLTKWFSSGPGRARFRCIEYILERAKLNLQIMSQLDLINRTSELARVFGIDFFSVLSRGSQYRVESMFLRLAHTQNYLSISPGNLQVANQPAMECLPLVMEPESSFYSDPVVVLDFQSLYPSMMIAYNLCFCTCLGKITPSKANTLGVSPYSADINILRNLKHELCITPNGVMYVPSKVRKGILPRLMEEILSTRIMVKQAMKKLAPSQQVLHRIFNARQLALKLIANVTYGYTAAGFSGRMPCAELADSIVQCGRRTLENAISFINKCDKWNARVIYGDTDSIFVLLKGRSVKEALTIGQEMASAITEMNPSPVTLKLEKVYYPCFLLTKKRYVGYSYERPDQSNPTFDAKGIETVRRDTCRAVSKTMEQSLRIFFEHQNIDKVKAYLQRQWARILSGRVSLEDFVFAKEVRLGTYSARGASALPPAAIVATKAMKADPRAEPRYAERVPYVVVHGEPGARLVDMVVDPLDLLAIDSPFRLNDVYYIRKQIIPALQRVFGLVGADLNLWFSDMPRPAREAVGKRHFRAPANAHRTRIDYYYLSKHCILCGDLVQTSQNLCHNCSKNEATVATALAGRTSKLEKDIQHLAAICRHCGGGDWLIENGVKCISLACSVFYERRKVQKELKSLSAVATEAGFYPRCMVEWF
ncbi:DNA polymerase zeta catalytic subunit [Forsythia ovata]|uniref:DNA polymerase n=1 Tax=Forsythia ovata TaxID=205694 RepID=A0ABD1VHY0_9LAMI